MADTEAQLKESSSPSSQRRYFYFLPSVLPSLAAPSTQLKRRAFPPSPSPSPSLSPPIPRPLPRARIRSEGEQIETEGEEGERKKNLRVERKVWPGTWYLLGLDGLQKHHIWPH